MKSGEKMKHQSQNQKAENAKAAAITLLNQLTSDPIAQRSSWPVLEELKFKLNRPMPDNECFKALFAL